MRGRTEPSAVGPRPGGSSPPPPPGRAPPAPAARQDKGGGAADRRCGGGGPGLRAGEVAGAGTGAGSPGAYRPGAGGGVGELVVVLRGGKVKGGLDIAGFEAIPGEKRCERGSEEPLSPSSVPGQGRGGSGAKPARSLLGGGGGATAVGWCFFFLGGVSPMP